MEGEAPRGHRAGRLSSGRGRAGARPRRPAGDVGLNQREETPKQKRRKRDRGRQTCAAGLALGPPPPSFLGNTFFHLLLIDTVYTLGLIRSQVERRGGRAGERAQTPWCKGPLGGLSRLGEGVSLTHVLGTVPKYGNPRILWIWLLPTVFCRFSVARHPVLLSPNRPRCWAAVPGHPGGLEGTPLAPA